MDFAHVLKLPTAEFGKRIGMDTHREPVPQVTKGGSGTEQEHARTGEQAPAKKSGPHPRMWARATCHLQSCSAPLDYRSTVLEYHSTAWEYRSASLEYRSTALEYRSAPLEYRSTGLQYHSAPLEKPCTKSRCQRIMAGKRVSAHRLPCKWMPVIEK